MELFIHSGADRKLAGIVESFECLRWTRRYSQVGAFELKAIATPENIALLREGNIVRKSDDTEAGIIERVELSGADREIVTASGRFATSVIARRIVWSTETLTGDISAAVGYLLERHMLNPDDPDRRIDGFSYTAPTLGVPVSLQTSYRNLLDKITELCDNAGVGIRTEFNPKTGMFTITLYNGGASDAVFSKEYENLTEQTYIESAGDYANTALVGGEGEGAERVFVTIPQGTGIDRREVFVDARDLSSGDFLDNYAAALTFRGRSRLSELLPVYGFDADVNPHGNLKYKTDFDLGQTVKVVSKPWGLAMSARITEIEETYDADGLSIAVTFGKSELTLAQKMRSDMSDVKTALLAPPQVISGGSDIPDGGVTTDKLGDSAVTSDKIADGAVGTAELSSGAVTGAKLADGSVSEDKLADGSITAAKLSEGALTTDKLADKAVSSDKLDDAAVTTSKLANGAVTPAKLAAMAATAMTVTTGTGVSVTVNTAYAYKTTVNVFLVIQVTASIAVGSTLLTVTNANFLPPYATQLPLLPSTASINISRVQLNADGTITNPGAALATGYYIICGSYPRI